MIKSNFRNTVVARLGASNNILKGDIERVIKEVMEDPNVDNGTVEDRIEDAKYFYRQFKLSSGSLDRVLSIS